MYTKKNKLSSYIIALLILTFPVIGINCKLVENPSGIVSAVQYVSLVINSDTTGTQSSATINWGASSDESRSDFSGYRVITYQLDAYGNINSTFDQAGIPKSTYTYTLDSIGTGVRYRSFVFSQLNDGSESDSVGTVVFAGVFYRTDGTIDEYKIGDQTAILSGYGWDVQTGIGENLPYLAEYTDIIDMHLRAYLVGELVFYSPTLFTPGTRSTYFSLVGSGQEAFDLTNLDEPTFTSVNVALDNVYLLKTQEGYYIKVWIRDISYVNGIVPYYNVLFDYKVQPIAGLRVL